jgi:TPP-dependent pyruvate/acetoin dehydrogenase alpha subunit
MVVDRPLLNDEISMLEMMMLIRAFETTSLRLSGKAKIPGGMHSAAGQEAVAVGTVAALGPQDILASTHRSHHHALAMGLSAPSVMAELYGKGTGCCAGRGGHMHLADFNLGLFGSNGIVGAGLGIAMGAAFAAKTLNRPQVVVGFFGDGGLNIGRVWEFLNLAQVWGLPLIAVCENNRYAVETHIDRTMASDNGVQRAAGFGLRARSVDGQDVEAMMSAVAEARQDALRGEGPTFIEADTYRFEGHNTGDKQPYRTVEEVSEWTQGRDPIAIFSARLLERGTLDVERLARMETAAMARVEEAVDFAEQAPWPDVSTVTRNVYGIDVQEWVNQ